MKFETDYTPARLGASIAELLPFRVTLGQNKLLAGFQCYADADEYARRLGESKGHYKVGTVFAVSTKGDQLIAYTVDE